MESETGQQRTEQATERRRTQAREKGQIARSRELTTAAVMMTAAVGFFVFGGRMLDGLVGVMRRGLSYERAQVFSETAMPGALGERLAEAIWAIVPLLGLLVAAAAFAPLALGGWNFSGQAIGLKFERLNPVEGMKRLFSWRGGMEMLKAFGKFVVVALVAGWMLWRSAPELLALGGMSMSLGLAHAAGLITWALLVLSASLLLVAAVDVPFQLWQNNRQLRMTRQEVRDEHKETEGQPELKSRIRRAQMELSRRRMMAEVPKADVIVTNPTHYAVALKYDQARQRAPVVIAKGRDLIAAEIRRLGREHRVPLLSAPSLARAIFHSTAIDREIPQGLYLAVAKVLAYVYQLRHAPGYVAPPAGDELPIPPELRRH